MTQHESGTGIIDFIPDAIFAIDRNGKVIFWNSAMEEMTGVEADEMVGKGDFEYAIPFYGERRKILIDLVFSYEEYISRFYSDLKKSGRMMTAESSLSYPKGKARFLWVKAGPLYDKNGSITGAIESIRDITEQKEIEERLRESERKRDFPDMLPQIIFETDANGFLVYMNKIGYETFGYSKEDFNRGIQIHQLIAPEDRTRAEKSIKEFLSGVKINPEGNEYNLLRKDGTKIPVSIYATLILMDENVIGFRGVIVDISGRKRIEKELKERERTLTTLIDNLPGVVYRCANDPDWTMIFISDRCKELTGYSPDDFISRKIVTYNDIIHPDYRKRLWDIWQSLLKSGNDFEEEYQIVTRSGETKWVWERGKGIFSDDGTLLYLEGLIMDVSEQRKINDLLKVSREQLSLAIEGSGAGLWDWNIPTGNMDINDQWAEIIGYTRDELKPVSINAWIKFCHPDDLKHSDELLKRHLKGEIPYYECESRMHHKDGRWIWVLDRGKVVEWDDKHNPVRMVGIHLDITHRRYLEDAIRKKNQQLNLLTGITRHDIRNQLTALYGYITISKETIHDPKTLPGYLDSAEKCIQTIERQIQFTRVYQDMGVQDPVWQNVKEIVSKVIPTISIRDINISFRGTEFEIYSDLLFEKVIYNLIDNALRYGGEKMTEISFYSEKKDNIMLFICEDDGEGISDSDRLFLFNQGYGKNTGFGLFLSREILNITGIEIMERSEKGNGARFEMKIPEGRWRYVHMYPSSMK